MEFSSHVSVSEISDSKRIDGMAGVEMAYTKGIRLYEDQATMVRTLVAGLVSEVQRSIGSRACSLCLIPFLQLNALQHFDLTPDIDVHLEMTRLQLLFVDSITDDSEVARRLVDEDMFASSEVFETTLKEVLNNLESKL